jgi:hypothetical protein
LTRPQTGPRSPLPAATPALQATPVAPWAAGLSQRRRQALAEVAAELGSTPRSAGPPAVALRDSGPGCLCVGIAGPVDRAEVDRLQLLLGELRGQGRHELLLTLTALGPWHPQLARVLARVRIQHLVDGASVELRDLPEALAAELGPARRTTFLGVETTPAGSAATIPGDGAP